MRSGLLLLALALGNANAQVAVIDFVYNDNEGVTVFKPVPAPINRRLGELAQPGRFNIAERLYGSINANHGNMMASVIQSVNPNADILRVKISNSVADVVAAIQHLQNMPPGQKPKLINMSFGMNEPCYQELQWTIDLATSNGTIFVAAVGNEGIDKINSPAVCRNVIAVGSFNIHDREPAQFSNRGDKVVYVPQNLATVLPYTWINKRGTSFSAAYVSGLGSLYAQNDPEINYEKFREILRSKSTAGVLLSSVR